MAIRVLLVEDQRILRDALVSLLKLESDIEVAGTAEHGEEVLPLIDRLGPDIVLLDIGLPGVDGLSLAREIRKTFPELRILMLTSLDKPGLVREALSAGVHGFLPKGISSAELVDGIRKVSGGNRIVAPALLSAAIAVGENPLTPRERSILQLAADGTPPPEIAENLFLAEGTVRNHITRVIGKLSARNATDAIRIAREAGWI